MKAESANGLEVYGGLVQEGVSHDEQEPRPLGPGNTDDVRDVRSVVGEHHLQGMSDQRINYYISITMNYL